MFQLGEKWSAVGFTVWKLSSETFWTKWSFLLKLFFTSKKLPNVRLTFGLMHFQCVWALPGWSAAFIVSGLRWIRWIPKFRSTFWYPHSCGSSTSKTVEFNAEFNQIQWILSWSETIGIIEFVFEIFANEATIRNNCLLGKYAFRRFYSRKLDSSQMFDFSSSRPIFWGLQKPKSSEFEFFRSRSWTKIRLWSNYWRIN